ncbi:class I SAM-dependent methyltransferase [candidate division TA06 bacterium]|nr:class I SAM-dependent methyltransferase [candidate division TA06 bacterium]
MNSLLYLHNQYQRQAAWTKALRLSLYRRVQLAGKKNILELGCGSGVILSEISERTEARLCGIEADPQMTALAKAQYPGIEFRTARAEKLPFPANSFDLIVTHYFWLWQKDPEAVLSEALRVLKKGGHLISLCEPDYMGRIDEPTELGGIRDLILGTLAKQGADPGLAGKLETLMSQAGFKTEAGRQDGCWDWREYRKQFDREWEFIEDLCGFGKRLEALKQKDLQAVAEKKRRMCMPVRWVIGQK